ncbi:MAG TPA: hypothetical protein DCY55_02640, partial [Gammaproteobacteria bacterium]|nr:hypothetical protein [Gammaproteobacteria bacterium]
MIRTPLRDQDVEITTTDPSRSKISPADSHIITEIQLSKLLNILPRANRDAFGTPIGPINDDRHYILNENQLNKIGSIQRIHLNALISNHPIWGLDWNSDISLKRETVYDYTDHSNPVPKSDEDLNNIQLLKVVWKGAMVDGQVTLTDNQTFEWVDMNILNEIKGNPDIYDLQSTQALNGYVFDGCTTGTPGCTDWETFLVSKIKTLQELQYERLLQIRRAYDGIDNSHMIRNKLLEHVGLHTELPADGKYYYPRSLYSPFMLSWLDSFPSNGKLVEWIHETEHLMKEKGKGVIDRSLKNGTYNFDGCTCTAGPCKSGWNCGVFVNTDCAGTCDISTKNSFGKGTCSCTPACKTDCIWFHNKSCTSNCTASGVPAIPKESSNKTVKSNDFRLLTTDENTDFVTSFYNRLGVGITIDLPKIELFDTLSQIHKNWKRYDPDVINTGTSRGKPRNLIFPPVLQQKYRSGPNNSKLTVFQLINETDFDIDQLSPIELIFKNVNSGSDVFVQKPSEAGQRIDCYSDVLGKIFLGGIFALGATLKHQVQIMQLMSRIIHFHGLIEKFRNKLSSSMYGEDEEGTGTVSGQRVHLVLPVLDLVDSAVGCSFAELTAVTNIAKNYILNCKNMSTEYYIKNLPDSDPMVAFIQSPSFLTEPFTGIVDAESLLTPDANIQPYKLLADVLDPTFKLSDYLRGPDYVAHNHTPLKLADGHPHPFALNFIKEQNPQGWQIWEGLEYGNFVPTGVPEEDTRSCITTFNYITQTYYQETTYDTDTRFSSTKYLTPFPVFPSGLTDDDLNVWIGQQLVRGPFLRPLLPQERKSYLADQITTEIALQTARES